MLLRSVQYVFLGRLESPAFLLSNATLSFYFPASLPCFTSLLHFPASLPCFTSLLHFPASLPCFTSLLHFPASLPCFTSLLHFPASLPCFTSLLLFRTGSASPPGFVGVLFAPFPRGRPARLFRDR